MAPLEHPHRLPVPQPSPGGSTALRAASLGSIAMVIAVLGKPVPSAAAAVIVALLASLIQGGKTDYTPLARVIVRIADALHGRG